MVTIGEGTATYHVALTKESITVSGTMTYNGLAKANMSITFTSDATVDNNNATYASAKADRNGTYTIELAPGSYNVSAEETVNENGQNVTYRGTAQITVQQNDAPKTLPILLRREEAP